MTEQQRSFNPDRAAMDAVSRIQAIMALGKFGAQKSAQIQDIIADTIRASLSHAEGEAVAEVTTEPDYWSRGHFYEGRKKDIKILKELEDIPVGTLLYFYPEPEVASLEECVQLDHYDAGILSGNDDSPTCWWHDYIRSELDAAHSFYQQQVNQLTHLAQQPVNNPGKPNKQVGCEREDGTLNIHDESKTCAVCAPDERDHRIAELESTLARIETKDFEALDAAQERIAELESALDERERAAKALECVASKLCDTANSAEEAGDEDSAQGLWYAINQLREEAARLRAGKEGE